MRIRTNLHIENDALAAASAYANAKGISLGLAVSQLILRAEQAPEPPASMSKKLKKDKYGYLVVKASGSLVTPEMVKAALEDDLDG
ncbi:MAG TPA: hypothetical protein VGT04_04070 [Acidobacteriaceae bacterium]|nr:hypothetical protein [Acidobacteriaceae bacterium]